MFVRALDVHTRRNHRRMHFSETAFGINSYMIIFKQKEKRKVAMLVPLFHFYHCHLHYHDAPLFQVDKLGPCVETQEGSFAEGGDSPVPPRD